MARPFVQKYRTQAGATRFRAWYYDAAGRKVGKVFHTKREADEFLRDRARDAATGTLTDTARGKATFESVWVERQSREEFAEATLDVQGYVWQHVGPTLGNRAVADIRPADVERALAAITASSMRDKARRTLVAVFNYAVVEGRIAVNPAKAARRSRTRAAKVAARNGRSVENVRRLISEELAALVGEVPARYAMLVELSGRVGLRPGEALALTVEQFDPEARTLTIDRTVSAEGLTKTGEARTILLPAIIAERLSAHIAEYATDGVVFPSRDGSKLTVNGWRHIFQRAAVKVGVNHGFSPNDLRHTAVAFAIAHGANVYDVQNMVGHAKPSITLDTYGFLWEASAERLAAALDEAIRAE
jgi:integrase